MQGMFKGNGGCGYVKKPNFLLQDDQCNGLPVPCSPSRVKMILKVVKFLKFYSFHLNDMVFNAVRYPEKVISYHYIRIKETF